MMLKARDAPYGAGRTKDMGVWWKWKVDPFSVDAVLIYAQRGHGRQRQFTAITPSPWDGPPESSQRALVPKGLFGLTDEEMRQVEHPACRPPGKIRPGEQRQTESGVRTGFRRDRLSRTGTRAGHCRALGRTLRWRQDKTVDECR
jgi:DNA ligase-1